MPRIGAGSPPRPPLDRTSTDRTSRKRSLHFPRSHERTAVDPSTANVPTLGWRTYVTAVPAAPPPTHTALSPMGTSVVNLICSIAKLELTS